MNIKKAFSAGVAHQYQPSVPGEHTRKCNRKVQERLRQCLNMYDSLNCRLVLTVA